MHGFHAYKPAIRDAFGPRATHGTVVKTLSVTDLRKNAAHRYSPAAVVAVSREVISGEPEHISTSYVEREHLSLRMSSKRFARLSNGFSKRLENHVAAVSLYVAHYNLCRVHEALRSTPAMASALLIVLGPSAMQRSLYGRSYRRLRPRPIVPASSV
jgi:IS1 family transposase